MLRPAGMLSVLFILILSNVATSHDPKDFTVILRDGSTDPVHIGEGILVEGDSLFFIDTDKREGALHRILVDSDGDGEFNGSDDFSTGWLSGSCDLDENGSKEEEGCMVTASLYLGPEGGLLPGNISMIHQTKVENTTTGEPFYVFFSQDVHIEPAIGNNSQEETTSTDNSASNPENSQAFLLMGLLLLSLLGAAIFFLLLIRKEE